jgi:hypothetical protein
MSVVEQAEVYKAGQWLTRRHAAPWDRARALEALSFLAFADKRECLTP